VSKLMEIIEKTPNFKKGIATLKFLDTSFTMLSRKIGSRGGSNFETAKMGDMLSKELLVSLNSKQLYLKSRLIIWLNNYNTWLNSIKNKIPEINNFEYNFSSLIDYSSKYVANKTLADYYLLAEVINAEKELYEFGHYWGRNHMLNTLNKMKEWSKYKVYGSSVATIGVEYETRRSTPWQIIDNAGLTVSLANNDRHDKKWVYISGMSNMGLGETRTVKIYMRLEWISGGGGSGDSETSHLLEGYAYFSITRNRLNSIYDDGYYTYTAWMSGALADSVRSWPTVTSWTGKSSPHFETSDVTLPWMTSRVLI
jgi:hypothetical protein